MGLFSFIKGAGAKLFKSKKEREATAEGVTEQQQAELDAQKAVELEGLIRSMGFEINDLYVEVQDDLAIVHGNTSNWEDKEKAILTAGNVAGVAQVDDRIEYVSAEAQGPTMPEEMTAATSGDGDNETRSLHNAASNFHTVIKGDTLSKIAKHYYGNANKYHAIFKANRPMLKSPDKIYVGQVLRIPTLQA